MLSQAQVVRIRKAFEKMYIGKCTVYEYQKVTKPNHSTGFEEVPIIENQPCKLSFKTISHSKETDSTNSISQVIKIFISPQIEIKPGSKLVIAQNGVTTSYKNSGQPAIYSTHQEIALELFKGWS